jgi:outer membrane protein assembly factor BamE (lipoprotein component of BamABCDE complex)
MNLLYSVLLVAALAGCAASPQSTISVGMRENEVSDALGQPVATGRLPTGEEYWDYSRQPFGYTNERVTFTAYGLVRDVRNLLTEDNFKNLRSGMTPEQVEGVVGPSAVSERREYAGGTKSWTYRYYDIGVIKLLNVIFDENDRVLTHYTEWDPSVYSKGGTSKGGGSK